MKIEADWLHHAGTVRVMAMLDGAGRTAWFVGGCVRNTLLGAPVDDIDIATDALPEEVVALGEAAGLRVVPTGIAHGTVTVIAGGMPHEVTTLRRDVETDGRHAVVAFTDDMAQDAARRDFTMNALYATADGAVLDPTGAGLADLAARRVRFIGAAEDRIAEDHLRILRFFRFHAWYGDPEGGLDADGYAACAAGADGLDRLARERIGAEMRKLLAAPDPAPAVAAMAQAGLLARVLPGADATVLPRLVAVEDGSAPDAIRRLAALGGEDPVLALRLSRADAKRLGVLRDAAEGARAPSELGYRLGAADACDALLLRAALLEVPFATTARADIARGAAARFPVRAADLMPGLSGPALGAALSDLEARWIASDFQLDRTALLSRTR